LKSKPTKSVKVVNRFDMECPSCQFDLSLSLKGVILRTFLGYICKPTVKYYGSVRFKALPAEKKLCPLEWGRPNLRPWQPMRMYLENPGCNSPSPPQWGIALLSRPFANTDSLFTLFLSTLNRNTTELEALSGRNP